MEKEKINRINELARKSKETELSEDERREQAELRAEYIAEIRASFGATLANTVIQRPDGSKEPLKKKDD
ncbi:MAG: DUF896 domain-containing protein [Ruminococcaceae bacterium]|nr:DUF896 domain-containing protein [Oscillospiraceae bacterium]